MKEFKFKGNVYQVPESWSDVTIAQQIEAEKLAVENPNLKRLVERSAYTGIPFIKIKEASIGDKELADLFQATSFIDNEPLPVEPIHEFEHNGFKYSVLDSLLEAQAQDYISTQVIINSNKGKSAWEYIPSLIAIIAKRPDETLDSYKVEDRAKEFETLSLAVANRLYVFFCLIANAFTTNSSQTLEQQDQVKRY